MAESYLQLLNNITTFIFDVDGVLTNGTILLLPSGEQVRQMNIKDGYALQLAKKQGYNICIISGGTSEPVRDRFSRLGIHDVFLGSAHKIDALDEYMETYDLKSENILYMGDDIPDYEVMQRVLLPCCPADAAQEIKELSRYVSPVMGGNGCARDVIEKTMRVQGKWFEPEHIEDKFENFKW